VRERQKILEPLNGFKVHITYKTGCSKRYGVCHYNMNKIATFGMSPYNFAFQVDKANLSQEEPNHDVTDQTLAQDFSSRPGSLYFFTLGDCMWITIEVWVAELADEISIFPETVRAILLPFSVDREGIKITDHLGVMEGHVYISAGNYALLFELKLRDDVEYLNSPQYQENVYGGFTEEWCRLTFYPRDNAVHPEILRLDAWSTPPYQIAGYAPLNPTYPLLME
jgi:hypothetical protein